MTANIDQGGRWTDIVAAGIAMRAITNTPTDYDHEVASRQKLNIHSSL